jgi:hypothetical protein
VRPPRELAERPARVTRHASATTLGFPEDEEEGR